MQNNINQNMNTEKLSNGKNFQNYFLNLIKVFM